MAFLQRQDGALVQRFLKKAVRLGHIEPIAYQHGRHIYHLKAKSIYGLFGEPDSQNRRDKGDRQIKVRLMQLDYVIEHFGQKFLETGQQKAEFFSKLRVPPEYLPRFSATGGEQDDQLTFSRSYFPERFPISVTESPNVQPLVSFTYIDDGLRTVSAFVRWLNDRRDLLRLLFHAEVVYVSDVEHNLDDAEREFLRRFPKPKPEPSAKPLLLPRGVDHLIRYLRARRSDDAHSPLFSEERDALADGKYLYQSPEFQKLVDDWKRGAVTEQSLRMQFVPRPKPPVIRGHVLLHDYPVWSVKYRRGIL